MTAKTTTSPTSTVPDTDTTVAAYVAADRSGRAKMRTGFDASMRAALASGSLVDAQGFVALETACKAAAGTVADKAPVDYAQLIANRATTYALAAERVLSGVGIDLPDDVTIDWDALPVGVVDADMVTALAARPLIRRSKVNDLNAALLAAFDGLPIGTRLSTSDVMKRANAAGFAIASTGGLAARITADEWSGPSCISPVESDSDNPRGFVLSAPIAGTDD